MQALHVDCFKLSWTENSAEILSRNGIYFFFPRRKKLVAARYPNLKLFQSFYADHAIEGYQTTRMLPELKAKQFTRISEPQAPFWSINFLPTPDSVSSSSRQNLVEDLPRCAIYWHTFLRDQPQPGFFHEWRERAVGTRLLHWVLFFIFQEWLNKVNNALFGKEIAVVFVQ